MPSDKKLFLLDAMALIYRAYFALNKNPRINSKGFNTSTLLGFTNTLHELIRKEKPTHIGVAFDTFAPTTRELQYVAYKANRDRMPDDIAASLPFIDQLLAAFRIPKLFVDGYEADDVIGTLAKKAEQQGFQTFMVTSDKDFGQLVSENIFMYKPARMGNNPEIWGVKEVCEKYEISQPTQLIDILGLWGDAVDNIPGIPGIGEKNAKLLIKQYGSMENLIAHAEELKGKQKENVIAFAQQGLECKMLATIILDVPIDFVPETLALEEPDLMGLKQLFDEMEFRNLASRIFSAHHITVKTDEKTTKQTSALDLFSSVQFTTDHDENPVVIEISNIDNTDHAYHLVQSEEDVEKLVQMLSSHESFCFDTETTGLDANLSELVGMSFAVKAHEAYYVPVPENYDQALTLVTRFKPVFEDSRIGKTGQNLKYDISVLKWYHIEVKGKLFDTMLAHYLIEPDLRHNMDFLSETYLKYRPIAIETLIGKKGRNQLSMRNLPPAEVRDYACEDADITLQLKAALQPKLAETDTLEVFEKIEIPLLLVLAAMESEGVRVDVDYLNNYAVELQEEIAKAEKEIKGQAGIDFNIASPKQLGEVLFDQLKIIEKPKLTKTKQYSTSEDVLIRLVNKHPIIQRILDYRSLTKLKSTYVDVLPQLINARTGRIHTSYNQAVAATGRLSSNNPNLQNIPIRTERGREIRKAFVPRNRRYTFLSADYSQIELRLMAEISGDVHMQEAFINGIDIHTATAAKVYGIALEQVSGEQRRHAKMVNFGIIYGISAFGLSERLGIARKEASDMIEQYFTQYPGIKNYMENTVAFAKANGYVETIMKRRRYIRDIHSANSTVRGYAERNAINAPIQGSAADMIKMAMITIYDDMQQLKMQSKMILQVHDELNFDAHLDEVNELKKLVENRMKNAMALQVPIEVEMNTGSNWLEAH